MSWLIDDGASGWSDSIKLRRGRLARVAYSAACEPGPSHLAGGLFSAGRPTGRPKSPSGVGATFHNRQSLLVLVVSVRWTRSGHVLEWDLLHLHRFHADGPGAVANGR